MFLIFHFKIVLFSFAYSIYFLAIIGNERVRLYGIGQIFDFIPPQISYISDLLFFTMLAVTILKLLLQKYTIESTIYDKLLILIIVVFVISSIVNNRLFDISTIASLRILLYFIGGYFILHYNNVIKNYQNSILRLLLFVSLLQLPFVLVERFIFDLRDLAAGLFTRYPKMIYFQTVIIIIGALSFFNRRNQSNSFRGIILITSISAMLSLSFSNSRAYVILIPMLLIIMVVVKLRKASVYSILKIIPISFLLIISNFLFFKYYGDMNSSRQVANSLKDPDYIQRYMFAKDGSQLGQHTGRLTRGGVVVYLVNRAENDPIKLLFGYGPGSYSKFKFSSSDYFEGIRISDLSQSQLSLFIGEFGVLSAILLLTIIITPLFVSGEGTPIENQTRAQYILRGIAPYFVVLNLFIIFYSRGLLELESSFLFWYITLSIKTY